MIKQLIKDFLDSDKRRRIRVVNTVKLLILLISVVLLISKPIFPIVGNIKILLSKRAMEYMRPVLNIALYSITTILVISFCIFIISLCIDKSLYKHCDDISCFEKLYRGSLLRIQSCLDYLIIFLICAYLFDYDVYIKYKNIYPAVLWKCIFCLMGFNFAYISGIEILRRFFTVDNTIMLEEINRSN